MIFTPKTQDAYKLLHQGTLALARAERQGIRFDEGIAKKMEAKLSRKILHAQKELEASKFYKKWAAHLGRTPNTNSSPQLASYLYDVLGIKPIKETATGKGAADEEALVGLNMPELEHILNIRKLKKIRDTYLKGFAREAVNGFIHPSFALHTVRTYRSSCMNPNFQNIPKRDPVAMESTRGVLFPRIRHQLLEADYGSLEVRIAACYHKDPVMLKYLNDTTTDMHGDTAQQIFKLDKYDKNVEGHVLIRSATKNSFVFPQFYGDYYANNAAGFAEWIKLPKTKWKKGQGITLGEEPLANHFISKGIRSYNDFVEHMKRVENDFWNNRFKVYKEWKEIWYDDYMRKGYIEMKTGFRCKGYMSKNDCINYPVQGAAFHCLLWSFIKMDEVIQRENWQSKLIGQIHDAIVMDVYPEELEAVKEKLQEVTCEQLPREWDWIIVPLKIEIDEFGIDKNWIKN